MLLRFWRWRKPCGAVLASRARIHGDFAAYSVTRERSQIARRQAKFLSKESFRVMAIGFAPFPPRNSIRGCLIERSTGVGRMAGSGGPRKRFSRFTIRRCRGCRRFVGICERADFQKDRRWAPAVALHMIYNPCVLVVSE